MSLDVDLRDYHRLGLHSALASRLFLFYNDGKNSRHFGIGGSWDLRGYAQGSLRGEKMWFLSEELRFPFFDFLGVQSSFGGVVLWQVRGALTFDVGGVWDRDYLNSQGSFGFGLRANLGQVVTLRWDLGKRIENNFSSLQHGLYSVLFFGWDF
jgi:hemolysin activation/secretion protein